MSAPFISVVITTYNRAPFLAKAVASALRQDYEHFEVVISDNCSTDNTQEILAPFLNDPRVQYSVNETNLGMMGNYRVSILEKAKGNYCAMLNSDDAFMYDSFLSDAAKIIATHEQISLVKGGVYIEENGTGKTHNYEHRADVEDGVAYFKQFQFSENLGLPGSIYHKDLVKQYGMLDKDVLGFDYLVNLQLCLMGKIGFVKKACYHFVHHKNNLSRNVYPLHEIKPLLNNYKTVVDFGVQKGKLNDDEAKEIKQRFILKNLANIIEDYYKNRRSELPLALNECAQFQTLIEVYFQSKRWKIFKQVYRIPKLGDFAVHTKWRLSNLLKTGRMAPKTK